VSCRILIVDDEPNQRTSLAIGLRLEGFEVSEAGDGIEALERLEHLDVDAAIVDVMMPRMNGLDLARRMAESYPAIRVLLTSAYHLSERQIERAGIAALAFVPKPCVVDELARYLREHLGASTSLPPPVPTPVPTPR